MNTFIDKLWLLLLTIVLYVVERACEAGWRLYNDHCYGLAHVSKFKKYMDFIACLKLCRTFKSKLAAVRDQRETDFIRGYL